MLKQITLCGVVALASASLLVRAAPDRKADKPSAERTGDATGAKAGLPKPDADGFIALFNGKDLTGWDGNPKFWSVRDGAITGQTTAENPTKGNTFLIYTGGDVDNFELRFKYKIVGGNSGVQYRSKARAQQSYKLLAPDCLS